MEIVNAQVFDWEIAVNIGNSRVLQTPSHFRILKGSV